MKRMLCIVLALTSVSTAGCVTQSDPAADAAADRNSCLVYGHKEGSQGYVGCRQQLAQNRQATRAQTNAAIGQSLVVGAALVGAAAVVASQPVYYQPYYYRCNYWGCW